MTRARLPHPHEVAAAAHDPRLIAALAVNPRETSWRLRGRCRTAPPDTFFPLPAEPVGPALSWCHSCDVQAACLRNALEVREMEGVSGNTTPPEQRAMLVAWRNRTAAKSA